jgi:hypothetical protein
MTQMLEKTQNLQQLLISCSSTSILDVISRVENIAVLVIKCGTIVSREVMDFVMKTSLEVFEIDGPFHNASCNELSLNFPMYVFIQRNNKY